MGNNVVIVKTWKEQQEEQYPVFLFIITLVLAGIISALIYATELFSGGLSIFLGLIIAIALCVVFIFKKRIFQKKHKKTLKVIFIILVIIVALIVVISLLTKKDLINKINQNTPDKVLPLTSQEITKLQSGEPLSYQETTKLCGVGCNKLGGFAKAYGDFTEKLVCTCNNVDSRGVNIVIILNKPTGNWAIQT